VVGAGKFFGVGFFSGDYRDGGVVHGEIGVDVQHLAGFEFGFFAGGVGGMAFLPIKFEGAEKKFGAELPADHAVPLIHEDGQIAIGLNPFGPHVTNDGLRSGANDQRLGQLFSATDGDDGEFR
jgi:hypothetical protein